MIQLGAPAPKEVPPAARTSRPPGGPRGPVFLAANMTVLGWLAVTVAVLIGHDAIEHPVWLAIHAMLLGAATNAIVIWSGHFTTTLCRVPDRPPRRLAVKLAVLNIAVVAALTGVWTDTERITGIAGAVVAVIAAVHGGELIAMKKAALSARFDYLVDFYLAAVAALLLGAMAGAAMAFGVDRWYARLWTSHVHVLLYGWIGFTVIGTLYTLWPTTIREKITDRSYRLARRTLPAVALGLGLVVAGLLTVNGWLTAAGFGCYAVGVVLTVVALWPTRRPFGPAAWMMVAAMCWLAVAVVIELVALLTMRSVDALPGLVENSLIPLLVVGFVAQILLGALTQLVPLLVSRGPAERKAVDAYFARGWPARLLVLNAAVPLVAAPLPPAVRLTGWAFAAIAVAVFVWLALRLALPVALRGTIGAKSVRAQRHDLMSIGVAVAALIAVAVTLTVGAGTRQPLDPRHGVDAAQTVDVVLKDMRVVPGTVEVPVGTRLVLRVTNAEAIPHDLRTETGERTPRLSRGQTALLDVGVVREDQDIWCDVPGHKAAGMTMTVRALGGQHRHGAQRHDGGTSAPALNLATDPSPGWTARDPVLAPAAPGMHRVELHAADRELEVAPGRRETRWTWGSSEPGPVLHGRVGDQFEITLINDSQLGHGIDFHAGSLAPDQPMRTLAPGERLVYRFTARRAGAWLYHCSTPPQSLHIANGMYGAVIIDPPGLPPVDREYVLVGAQLYLGDPHSDAKTAAIAAGRPDGWMFNGMADQYVHAPLAARPGERVRIWVVNAGPGDAIAFHIVGTQFDTVYKEGAWLLRAPDPAGASGGAQVLDLAPAQGGFVELSFPEPGHYMVMDHNLHHADGGARGMFVIAP